MSILRKALYIAHGHRWAIPINRGSPYLSMTVIFSYIQLQDKRKLGNISEGTNPYVICTAVTHCKEVSCSFHRCNPCTRHSEMLSDKFGSYRCLLCLKVKQPNKQKHPIAPQSWFYYGCLLYLQGDSQYHVLGSAKEKTSKGEPVRHSDFKQPRIVITLFKKTTTTTNTHKKTHKTKPISINRKAMFKGKQQLCNSTSGEIQRTERSPWAMVKITAPLWWEMCKNSVCWSTVVHWDGHSNTNICLNGD